MVRELTCISCPLGCPLKVELDESGRVVSVTGNTCKRGEEYGKKEVTAPTPVRTQTDIPTEKIFACMEEIRRAVIKAPVHIGDVVIHNVAGTGVDVTATKAAV